MTAVASPPSLQPPHARSAWSSNGSAGLNSMQDEVSAMFMPRKSAQRSNSSSSLSSNSSSSSSGTATNGSVSGSANTSGTATPVTDPGGQGAKNGAFPSQEQSGNVLHRKKPARPREANGPWPIGKAEASAGVTSARPQSILATNGVTATSSMSNMQQQQQHSVVPSQGQPQTPTQQQNGVRPNAAPTEATPALYLLSQNGTFDRKTISVPYYPDNLRIGRQTNAKTAPTSTNGYFDSKVLSRQHAEIWSDRLGKIWIRDVRSSNGTFVNGSRLSAENKDSQPHELQTGDHLELGIDIVSEDQKTVVHHKVAAKVEHAGFLGPGGLASNVLDMGFGDLDPSNGQNGLLRGRTNTQGSIPGQQQRPGQQMGGVAGQQISRNFWLTPITTEAIVKRLTHEMRQARLQSGDLAQTEDFLSTILNNNDFAPVEKQGDAGDSQSSQNSQSKAFSPMVNGQPTKIDPILVSRFSDPPAPPPQQPLPEKPDGPRLTHGESFLKRSNTARPASQSGSPVKGLSENAGQIVTLLAALKTANKELESRGDRMRELEDALQAERQARLEAEETAKRLEANKEAHINSVINGLGIEEDLKAEPPAATSTSADENTVDASKMTDEVESTARKLQEKLEIMMVEMTEMKSLMETYRQRAENAEHERDDTRKTLAEMVQKIRGDDSARAAKKMAKAERRSSEELLKSAAAEVGNHEAETVYSSAMEDDEPAKTAKMANGAASAISSLVSQAQYQSLAVARQVGGGAHRLDANTTAPYASMVGVVLVGLGIMTYLNGGWQKVDRG